MEKFLQWLAEAKSFFSSIPPTIAATAITAFTTLLGTCLVLFFGWLKERRDDNKRQMLIKEATDQVAFWKQWYEARQLATPDSADKLRAEIKYELDTIAKEFRRGTARPAIPHSIIRRILLLYKPFSYLSWLPRLAFYYLVGIGVLLASLFLSGFPSLVRNVFVAHPGLASENPTAGAVSRFINPEGLFVFVAIFFLAFIYLVLVFTVRAIAVDLDKDGSFNIFRILSSKRWHDAGLSISLLFALTVIVWMRRQVGLALLRRTWIFGMACAMLAVQYLSNHRWSLLWYSPHHNASLRNFALAFVALGLWQRYRRKQKRQQGDDTADGSLGLSWFSFLPWKAAWLYRVLDPLLAFSIGAVIFYGLDLELLGVWIMASSVAFFAIEEVARREGEDFSNKVNMLAAKAMSVLGQKESTASDLYDASS